jgi:beta,beta-carotene 9',10'-dioxygenase
MGPLLDVNGKQFVNILLNLFSAIALLVLAACQSERPPSQTPEQTFSDERLLFDMEEEVTRYSCLVQGEMPKWLSGTLLRNGPAKFQVGEKRVDWFDGLAMLHAFEFSSGQVVYSNRFLRSAQYYTMIEGKSLNFSGFAQDPCPKVFGRQVSLEIPESMKGIHNADVSIQMYADRMVALTEIPLPVIFDPKTLDTLGTFPYQDQLVQGQWESAHPLRDPVQAETINYFIRFGRNSSYVVWKMLENEATRKIIAEIPVEMPSYMHSFALTEHYVILVEFPFVVNPLDLLLEKKPFIFNYQWKPALGTQFLVINRASGEVVRIKGEPFFAFHHVNAFDREGKIFIDTITHSNANIIGVVTEQPEDANGVEESERTRMERFTIDLSQKEIARETLFDQTTELPRVPSDRVSREYRYCYAVDMRFPTTLRAKPALYQIDVVTKKGTSWAEEGCFPGEPIFVPDPDGQSETDGVVLSVVLDFAHHRSFLLVLDAKGFKEIARAEVPNPIPVGLHGFWKSF